MRNITHIVIMSVYSGQKSMPPGYITSLHYFPRMYEVVKMLFSHTKAPITAIVDLWIQGCCAMICNNHFFQAPGR